MSKNSNIYDTGSYPPYIRQFPINYSHPQRHEGLMFKQTVGPFSPISVEVPSCLTKAWLLAPAIIGTGLALVLSQTTAESNCIRSCWKPAKIIITTVLYAAGSTIAVAYYLFLTLHEGNTDPISFFLPTTVAISVTIIFFTAIYTFLYRSFPSSFEGEIGDTWGEQFISFLYFSITSISVGGCGDILPRKSGIRLLTGMEALFNLFIIAIGISNAIRL